MNNLPIGPMFGVLTLLILWSGLLTAVDAAHQYLKAVRPNGRATDTSMPKLAFELGSLILSNTLIKVLITIISMLLALHFWYNNGPTLAWIGVSSVLLIFAEFIPRTLAARYPEAILMLGNSTLRLPMKLLSPLAWLFSAIACTLLRPFGIRDKPNARKKDNEVPLTVLLHDGQQDNQPSRSHVLSGIHALDSITVNDILVPRSEVDGINLDDPIQRIIEQLIISRHTRLPVYHNDINQVEGVLNTRQISHLLPHADLTKEDLIEACYDPYFVPESTPLQLQLLNFHKQQRRLGVVVDEYGEVLGIVSLEDILEEIVGEFENEQSFDNPHIHPQTDGRLVIDGAASIRELNKSLGWHLPSDGPKTLNGLVTEALETIPDSSVCVKIGPYRLEILETEDNRVTRVLMWQNSSTRAAV
ncbi:transporter associated domain-containing protein [Pseudomonas sp. RTC3]|uniref:HlyC/CorC family transporter n=1 Tax=unclassified Pseudomonas TaxID=196821 RepID=UPI002AB500B1|nr:MULTISPECIES: transporter associated domain-containing protein [unclassified Pseudomonas]MDY7563652.1 CNNM domain-containing protein [Pseudomonas sp. 5C2]MEB0062805.1 transporter associated domain-containing protein [Pseudomonas sp. RTC3]MEB0147886.1 transporter associated domain-containing protein [Pseudomonas sp. CCC2.2]MEB0241196.1 transporter associated domain-containing protein [Pseudomonas sp. 5C2]